MSISKKAISVGLSAAMLASLVAAVAAPAVLATTAVTSAGVVPAGGTTTGTVTFAFTENAASSLAGGGGSFSVTICDSSNTGASSCTGGHTVGFSGTPVAVGPGSLGTLTPTLSTSVGGYTNDTLTIQYAASATTQTELITVSGLKVTAASNAASGAVEAFLDSTGAGQVGNSANPTGVIASIVDTTHITVTESSASTCVMSAGDNITVGTQSNTISAISGTYPTFAITLGTALIGQGIGTTVTDTTASCGTTAIGAPATVGASITQNVVGSPALVYSGQNNQPYNDSVADTTLTESQAGTLAAGTVITFTVANAGVTFSHAATVDGSFIDLGNGAGLAAPCVLSFNLTSCSVTVKTAGAKADTLTLSGVQFDVAASVASGSSINLNVTTSPAIPVVVTANTVAYVNRTIVGVGALPTVYIGYNAQPSGLITVTETAAGFFQAGTGNNNQLSICVYGNQGETFTFAPYAVVTTGDLKLLNTTTLLGATSQQATLSDWSNYLGGYQCATWTVYSASTVASTISIVGATASGPLAVAPGNGPTLSIPSWAIPGPVRMTVATGNGTTDVFSTIVTNAVRAFKSGVVVSAVSQPFIAPGTTGAAGDVTISETLNGQIQAGEYITCRVVDATYGNNPNHQILLSAVNSNDLPVVTTNTASGLIAYRLLYDQTNNSFVVFVAQQAAAPALGTITISNLHYTAISGAALGPVTLHCYLSDQNEDANVSGTGAAFDAYVSNAVVGSAQKVVISAKGSGGTTYSTSTQVLAKGQKLTVTFRTNPKLAGQKLGIWLEVKAKGASSFGAFKPHASIVLDVDGVGTYTYTASSGVKIGLSGRFAGNSTLMAATSYPTIFGLFK